MKPACRDRVGVALGAPVTDAQAALIDARIEQSMRALSRQQGKGWFAKTEAQRITEAAEHAAQEIEATTLEQRRIDPWGDGIATPGTWRKALRLRIAGETDAEIARKVGAASAESARNMVAGQVRRMQAMQDSGVAPEDIAGRVGLTVVEVERALTLEPRSKKDAANAELYEKAVPLWNEEVWSEDRAEYVPSNRVKDIAEKLGVTLGKLSGVLSRYDDGRLRPRRGGGGLAWRERASRRLNQGGAGAVRGDFTAFARAGADPEFRIRIFAARDMSTALHESAHYFLEVMSVMAEESPQTAALLDEIKAWMGGLAENETLSMSEAQRTGKRLAVEKHELFARTFEAYLMEGRAPSLSLQRAFAMFARWLTRIYESVVGIERAAGEVRLNPEIAAVFDRMLATQREIAEARAAHGSRLMTREELGMTEEQHAAYRQKFEDARQAAEDALRAEIMAEYVRDQQAMWKRRAAQHRRTVTLEVNGQRDYRADEWIGRGRWLDGAAGPVATEGPHEVSTRDGVMSEIEAVAARGRAEREAAAVPTDAREAFREYMELSAAERSFAMERALADEAQAEIEAEYRAQDGRRTIGYAHAPSILPLRQFVGINAETADHGLLADAYYRVQKGEDPAVVWRETGWFAGPDGKWRFEIDDSGQVFNAKVYEGAKLWLARLPAGQRLTGKLGAFVQHEQLFKAYPGLADTVVNVSREMLAGTAETNVLTGEITISAMDSPRDAEALLTHEVQHLVQMIEGFSMGGNAKIAEILFARLPDAEAAELLSDIGHGLHIDVLRNRLYMRITGEVEAYDTQDRQTLDVDQRFMAKPKLMVTRVMPSPPATAASLRWLADEATRLGIRAMTDRLVTEGKLDPVPVFYSALERAIEASTTARASAQQWKATITRTAGLKREEVDWTGVNEFLDAQEGDGIVAYHGGPTRVEKFDETQRGRSGKANSREAFFFAVEKSDAAAYGEVTEARLSLRNPKTIEGPIQDNNVRQLSQAREAGHDGVIFTDEGKPYAYAVFSADTIRPAGKTLITRDALLAFIRANGVRVEETVLGEEASPETKARLDEIQTELLPLLEEEERLKAERDAISLPYWDSDKQDLRDLSSKDQKRYDATVARLAEIRDELRPLLMEQDRLRGNASQTKWGQFALPGGENYRELLLRLPVNSEAPSAPEIAEAKRIAAESGDDWDTLGPNGRQRYHDLAARKVDTNYRSSHWSEPNVLAHIRFKERIDSDGARVLAIEEVQSDWHQAGRERGYRYEVSEADRAIVAPTAEKYGKTVDELIRDYESGLISNIQPAELREAMDRISGANSRAAVPDAPFKNNAWAALAMKRMVRWAAENGFDKVAWVPGDVVNERFSLEQLVNQISASPEGDGTYTVYVEGKDGHALIRNRDGFSDNGQKTMTHAEMREMFGGEIGDALKAGADATVGAEGKYKRGGRNAAEIGWFDLKPADLKMGGQGNRAFYDRILVNIANDIGKKFGARVGETTVPADERNLEVVESAVGVFELVDSDAKSYGTFSSRDDAYAALDAGHKLHSLPITPELREAALQGMPLFQRVKEPDPAVEPKPADLRPVKLSRAALAEYEREFGPDLAKRLKRLTVGGKLDAETAAHAESIAEDIAAAHKQTERGKRLWVWIREKGGIADEDVRERIDGSRKFPGLYNRNGRQIDELVLMAVEEGFVEMQEDADGYIAPIDEATFRDMIDRDIAGDEQRSAVRAEENEAYEAAREALAHYERMGIDTNLTGRALLRNIAEVVADDAMAVHPDEAAEMFGYSSGSELIADMLRLKPRAQAITEETERRMIAEHGDLMRDGRIQEEAQRAAHTEAYGRQLEIELLAIARALNNRARPMGRAARTIAERQLAQMTVRQVMGVDQLIAAERRFGLAAQKALAAGDAMQAERMKHRQLVTFHLYRAAQKAKERIEREGGRWRRLARSRTSRAAIDTDALAQIDALLMDVGVLPAAERPAMTLEQWAQSLEDEAGLGQAVAFQPASVVVQARRPLTALTMAEFEEVADAIRNIEHIGRGLTKMRKAQDAAEFQATKTELLQRLQQEWPDKLAKNVSRLAPDRLTRGLKLLDGFHALQLKVDYLARLLDGLKENGPWAKALTQPAQRAESALQARQIAAMAQLQDILEAHGVDRKTLNDWMTRRIWIEEIGDNLTLHQIVSVALNVGNAYNRDAIMLGEGWTPEQLNAVLSRLEKREWDLVQSLWDYVGQWKEESFALDERTHGVRPAEVQAQAFATRFGMYRGGYWPVRFDSELSDAQAKRDARDAAIGEMGGGYRKPATARGRLKVRTGTGGQALQFEWFAVLDRHVRETLLDLTHRELVMDLRRIAADREVRAGIAQVSGKSAVRALDDWIHRLARKPPPRMFGDFLNGAAAYLNRASTNAQMGFKVSVAVLNLLGSLQAVPRNGVLPQLTQVAATVGVDFPLLVAKQIGRLFGGDGSMPKRIAFVREKSAMMRDRMSGFDRDLTQDNTVQEVKASIRGRRDLSVMPKQVEDMLHILTGMADAAVSVPTWLAAYENAVAGKARGIALGDEEAAIAHADQVVRTTQGSGRTKDLSALLGSDNEMQRFFTRFMNWANGFYNQLFAEQLPGVVSGKISAPRFAANLAFIWLLPALISMWFFGRLEPEDGESDEERLRRIALETAVYPGQAIVVVRDLLSAAFTPYRPQTPYAQVIERTARISDAVVASNDRKLAKESILLFGALSGAPTAQGYVTGDYLYDVVEGDEQLSDWTDPELAGDAASEALVRDTR